MKCLMKAGYLRSVYESMFIDKANMIDLLINTVLPKFDDEGRKAVMLHARLPERQVKL